MKVIKPAGQELSPNLSELLNIVYAKRPLLEYHAESTNENSEVVCVTVWQDGQKLGEINTHFRRYSPSKGANERWILIRCKNINKTRGSDRSAKFTKNVKAAAQDVIKLFTKRPLESLGSGLILRVKSNVRDMYSTTHYMYTHSITVAEQVLIPYFLKVLKGSNPPIPDEIKTQLETPATIKKIENMQIAQNVFNHFNEGNGYALHVMQDESILCAPLNDPASTCKYASTFEMSEALQEKFTMLKLLEHNQFATDVGVKIKIDDGNKTEAIYFIVGGKIKTI